MEFPQFRPHHNILDIFAEEKRSQHGFLRVCAPMVRYSKMEFRLFLRKHGVKLCFTPMIIAESFNNSIKARDNEFTTCNEDQPVIAQFAAKNSEEFVTSAKLIYPYVDGVDLNCGCPQSWAIAKGYGCGLLRKPELVCDMIQKVRRTLPTDFSVSLKIRLLNGPGDESVKATVELARQLEKCGVTFLTLHGRTMWQRSSDPLNINAMATVKDSLQIPLIVNGNVRTWQDACELHDKTLADGVMAARGLLSNPTIFDPNCVERDKTSMQCVQEWLDIATKAGGNMKFQSLHHHLTFMWSNHIKRAYRQEFNNLTKKSQVFKFFEDHYGVRPSAEAAMDPYEYTKCSYTHFTPCVRSNNGYKDIDNNWSEDSDGKFFKDFSAKVNTVNPDSLDCDVEDNFLAILDS